MNSFALICLSFGLALSAEASMPKDPPAKTLKCQVTYNAPKAEMEKMPAVIVKATRDVDAPRLEAKATQTTSDGRYTINMSSLQPVVPADFTKFEQVYLDVTDNTLHTDFSPTNGMIGAAKQDIDHAEAHVVTDGNTDNIGMLDVSCDLVK